MKKHFFLLLIILSLVNVNAKELYTYTEWFDFYPDNVEKYRIESEDRYLWTKEYTNEEGKVVKDTTNEYYAHLDGYTKIDDSLKTFYRVNNGPVIIFNSNNEIVYDSFKCIKNICRYKSVTPYSKTDNKIVNVENPKTSDNIDIYIVLFIVSYVIIRKNNLLLSNCFKIIK